MITKENKEKIIGKIIEYYNGEEWELVTIQKIDESGITIKNTYSREILVTSIKKIRYINYNPLFAFWNYDKQSKKFICNGKAVSEERVPFQIRDIYSNNGDIKVQYIFPIK